MTTQATAPRPCATENNLMLSRPFRVRKVYRETHDTFTLELVPVDGVGLEFKPGQCNMLYAFGVGEVPISISGDPARTDVLVHTIRAVGTVTKVMQKLKTGEEIGVRGPFGAPWPVRDAEGSDVIIMAGGIGLAPLRPALYHLLEHRARYGKVVLLYGTRTPNDILFRKEVEQLRSRFDMEVLVTVDRAVGNWRGNVGVVTTLLPKASFDPANTIAMVCGPEIMMRFAIIGLRKRGLEFDQMYVSMERNMKCAIGLCGHCQFGPFFVCKDGPVFRYDKIKEFFIKREI